MKRQRTAEDQHSAKRHRRVVQYSGKRHAASSGNAEQHAASSGNAEEHVSSRNHSEIPRRTNMKRDLSADAEAHREEYYAMLRRRLDAKQREAQQDAASSCNAAQLATPTSIGPAKHCGS